MLKRKETILTCISIILIMYSNNEFKCINGHICILIFYIINEGIISIKACVILAIAHQFWSGLRKRSLYLYVLQENML